ncbi:GHMP kinase [Cellulophaga sp. HaHaR_3_176]|uniref:GYDIA family GHMP kinase n=1 Tax=Cellulophaga sp. HaHaR_3_176 TaxID=1942464 RepID=UPI001C1FB70D|nr:GYDIA family GHMP kinase [Cellulophaga sp. HaHaR_3_176]QWX83152.1 GHMP kinase [Cellulophaga sp. HaHaR_3_176]
MTKKFYSNGKLLITGEYAVLDGAISLAIPTKKGQTLLITEKDNNEIYWQSLDITNKEWFTAVFDLNSLTIKTTSDQEIASILQKMLIEAKKLNFDFLNTSFGYEIKTELGFARDWGLGSSSTLINNIAQWAKVDPYTLLWNSFKGSGYDIACASNNTPITYQLIDKRPITRQINFNPTFKDAIYFIHLNKKQNSRDGITTYRKAEFDLDAFIIAINKLTEEFITCTYLETFQDLIKNHEAIVSKVLKTPTIQEQLFYNYKGAIKSLGAWGGDFIMAAGDKNTPNYFKDKGYTTVLSFDDMTL